MIKKRSGLFVVYTCANPKGQNFGLERSILFVPEIGGLSCSAASECDLTDHYLVVAMMATRLLPKFPLLYRMEVFVSTQMKAKGEYFFWYAIVEVNPDSSQKMVDTPTILSATRHHHVWLRSLTEPESSMAENRRRLKWATFHLGW